ncbi:SCP-like protein, partial [Oesophagostomum dentatum]
MPITSIQGIDCGRQAKFMTPELRAEIIGYHNQLRANLSKGLESYEGKKLHPAKNMYKLNYNCTLERRAENFFRAGTAERPGALETLQPWTANYYEGLFNPQIDTYNRFISAALYNWWNQSSMMTLQSSQNIYLNKRTEGFCN